MIHEQDVITRTSAPKLPDLAASLATTNAWLRDNSERLLTICTTQQHLAANISEAMLLALKDAKVSGEKVEALETEVQLHRQELAAARRQIGDLNAEIAAKNKELDALRKEREEESVPLVHPSCLQVVSEEREYIHSN